MNVVGSVEPNNSQVTTLARAPRCGPCAIILSGGLRSSPLIEATGSAPLDLYLSDQSRVIDIWVERLSEVMGESDAVCVVPSHSCPAPRLNSSKARLTEEPDAFRGPGGVVRDVAQGLGEGTVLVLEGARYLDASLVPLMQQHRQANAMATIAMNPDGSPAGVYAIEREAIELVPARGFMDLKEQWLPKIQRAGRVEVVQFDGCGAMPLQSRWDFLAAARRIALGSALDDAGDSVWWSSQTKDWSVCGPATQVDDGAFVEASALQAGVIVQSGAIVSRSIVCEGAVIRTGEQIVDQVIQRRESQGRRDTRRSRR